MVVEEVRVQPIAEFEPSFGGLTKDAHQRSFVDPKSGGDNRADYDTNDGDRNHEHVNLVISIEPGSDQLTQKDDAEYMGSEWMVGYAGNDESVLCRGFLFFFVSSNILPKNFYMMFHLQPRLLSHTLVLCTPGSQLGQQFVYRWAGLPLLLRILMQ
jgi:hypothetical protein